MAGNYSDGEMKIFEKNLLSLIRAYKDGDSKVILLTHKHRMHYENLYKSDINKIIKNIIIKNNISGVDLYDISDLYIQSSNADTLDSIFPADKFDPASHPNVETFKNKIAPLIAEKINYAIKK